MTDNQKFLAGLILGAAAGAAIALFLQTEKGKEIIGDVKDAADNAGKKVKEKLADFDDQINAVLQKGKEFVEDIESKAAERFAPDEN